MWTHYRPSSVSYPLCCVMEDTLKSMSHCLPTKLLHDDANTWHRMFTWQKNYCFVFFFVQPLNKCKKPLWAYRKYVVGRVWPKAAVRPELRLWGFPRVPFMLPIYNMPEPWDKVPVVGKLLLLVYFKIQINTTRYLHGIANVFKQQHT